MSDLRFVRELGAEFERLERARAAGSGQRRLPSWPAKLPRRLATAVAIAVPLAIAVLAISLLSPSRHAATTTASQPGLALSGGNCRAPERIVSPPGSAALKPASGEMIRAAGGRVAGIPWQLRVKAGAEMHSGIEHGKLRVGGRQYGLCSRQSVPVPFGLINAGPHGIVYGYVAEGGGSYRITVSAGATPLTTSTANNVFFITALPHPACSYRALSVTATSTPVTTLPPDISRSLNDTATHLTTMMRFGACRPHALVTATSEHSQTSGRSPNAPLAKMTAQLNLTRPPGSRSHARGTVWELAHAGQRGIQLLAVGLGPGRYGIWLIGPHAGVTTVGAVTIKHHELQGSFDLPADASTARQIVVTAQAPGRVGTPGRVVLRARLP
jgi:hypothetical protein